MLENRSSADSHVTTYRPDLDGLRAVAVLAVVAYHLVEAALPGGYLGVDIFFVLSGYLITSIIWREALLGQFSIVTFYNRRIRRILPALLVVVIVTQGASLLLLLPLDLVGLGRSALASLGFVANIYFWRDTDYFSRAAEEKPLLHIWSLGVEEQFYLLFPLLLMVLARQGRRRTIAVLATLLVASLAANFFALRIGGAAPAFYLLPTRAWELGAGALLALIPPPGPRSNPIATAAGLTGGVLVALSLASGRALLPAAVPDALAAVAGTTLLIWAGAATGNPVRRVLSLRAPVFIGLISYSLYLWHWPVIVLLKYYLVREPDGPEVVGALALMFACAVVSWHYIERPFRSRETTIRTVYLAAGSATLAATAAAITILVAQGFPARLDPAAARINAAVGTNYRCPIPDYLYFSESRACALNLPSREPAAADVVLFGNSNAQMYAPLVREILAAAGQQGLLVPMNACTPTLEFNVNRPCAALAARNLDAITRLPRARVVVVASTWPNEPGFLAGLDRTIDRLAASGMAVVLVGPVAAPGWDVASGLSRALAFGRPQVRPLFEPRPAFLERYGRAIAHFEARRDIELVRPDEVQCATERCEYLMDGRSLFADSGHLATAELPRFHAAFEAALARALAK